MELGKLAQQVLQPFEHSGRSCKWNFSIFVLQHLFCMKTSHYVLGFLALFCLSFAITGCLNPDNEIPENCYDGELNNGEEGVDCGGPCPLCDPCTNGLWDPDLGETWVDCGGECGECDPSNNGIQDGDETGVDCGGSTGISCGELCGDGLPNGLEDGADPTGISPNPELADCGGPSCPACPTCTDMLLNGDEIGIDCGGPDCPPCATDGNCLNNVQDGDEQWIDCGGSTCPTCTDTLSFFIGGVLYDTVSGLGATLNGDNSITITGTTLASEQFAMTINEPVATWLPGVTAICNPASAADGQVAAFTASDLSLYNSASGTGNFTVEVVYIEPMVGGIIVCNFGGALVKPDLSGGVSLTGGFCVLNLN